MSEIILDIKAKIKIKYEIKEDNDLIDFYFTSEQGIQHYFKIFKGPINLNRVGHIKITKNKIRGLCREKDFKFYVIGEKITNQLLNELKNDDIGFLTYIDIIKKKWALFEKEY